MTPSPPSANAFLARVTVDDKLRRFWDHRGEDGVEREKQLLIDFLCASAGGPLLYTGRDMKTTHKGWQSAKTTGGAHSLT